MFRTATANTTAKSSNSTLFQKKKSDNAFIQPKLTVGKPGDKYEVEADRVADKIVAKEKEQNNTTFDSTPPIQKQKEEDIQTSTETENQIQEKPLADSITPLIQKQTEETSIQEKEEQEEVQKLSEEETQNQEITEETQVHEKVLEENNTSLIQQQTEEEPIQEKEEQEEIQQKPEEEIQAKVEDEVQQQETIPEPQAPEIIENNNIAPDIQNVEEEVQEKEEEEEEESIQEKRFVQKVEEPDGNSNSETSSIESQLNSKSGGASLPQETQSQMESGFGTDFSNVKVHTDSSAVQMNKDLGAQAFTHGNDIYFNEGKYDTTSTSGKHLLAHELTHTVQQGASVQPKMIQKADDEKSEEERNFIKTKDGSLDLRNGKKEVHIHTLKIPRFKRNKKFYPEPPFRLPPKAERNSDQRQKWDEHVKSNDTGLDKKLENIYDKQIPAEVGSKKEPRYYLKVRKAPYNIIGTKTEIKNKVLRPFWDHNGTFQLYHVDHQIELQLGGPEMDVVSNMWLLDAQSNISSGAVIKANKDRKLTSIINKAKESENFDTTVPNSKDDVRGSDYKVYVDKIGRDGTGFKTKTITLSDATAGKTVKGLEAISSKKLQELRGSPNEIVIFFSQFGGVSRRIPWEPGMTSKTDLSDMKGGPKIGDNFKLTSVDYTHGVGGTVHGKAFEKKNEYVNQADLSMKIQSSPIVEYGGVVPKSSLRAEANKLIANHFSPITFSEVSIIPKKGIYAKGKIKASLPVIKDVEIDILINGNEVSISKTFNTGEFNMPSSIFKVNGSSLTVSVGTKGLDVKGQVDFEIKKVGDGYIAGGASTSGGFDLEGAFNFDSELFDPAEIKVEYKNDIWTISGEIGIPEGKVPGIKKAKLTANYSENKLKAEGEADLDIPGVESSRLSVVHGDEGFSVEGDFQLNADLPGIKSGSVHAKIAKNEGDQAYDIFISGKAKPDIPGIDSEIDITYDNGALLIQGKTKVKLEKSNADGEVTVGVTNQVIGEDNKPTGEISESWSIFGSGDVSFVLTKGIVANAKVVLQPNGDIIVSGGVALDRSDKKPKEKKFDKNLFKIGPPDIILFALPIGVSLTLGIEGRADLYASFMPPYFEELQLSFDNFNLTKPEDNTEIAGKIIVAMSGKAGVKLSLTLSATLSALIAKVTGSLIGSIGLEANALATAELGAKWSNANGLEIEKGEISLEADAQFLAELKGKIRVYLDLWLAEIDIWEEELEIAKVKFGDSLKVGFKLPLSTENGELKAGEINKDSFTYPDISSDSEQQKIVEQGAKEDEKVKPPPPPSKEEAVAAVRKLDEGPVDFWNVLTMDADQARALVAFNWITRDTYIMWLKTKHAKIDWSDAVAMGRRKDKADFENFKAEVRGMEQGFMRIMKVSKFKKDHFLFSQSKKNEIMQLMTPEEESV
ncbi:eCIS core domain-containing protein [Aquimarina sp. 2201CG14-23]|uniref:eCIS core domain-containing protein n=1 Tax=Aquimarina mycalae TaxID=3040073 RepID=UPI00247814F9|nr:DUF4157 domain-containing protein [Aquimarina sp. 2201CG14-23]MDH7444129.1 DUF4157 domain-containing protein [Aquimarina sp. 2201CG14-23]